MIAIVDCNNFYASCERLFNPAVARLPIVVLSNNDGCVIARSEEAKELGIVMGTPAHLSEKLFKEKGVVMFSSNYTLYGSLSNRVMKTLAGFVPSIEIYSIDEAFLDLADMGYTDLLSLALTIRRTVKKHIGLPVSIGIAPTKTLAKMANRYAKKNRKEVGVYWAATDTMLKEMLAATAVEDIWGIGRQYATLLRQNGFITAADFVHAPDDWVRQHMSVVGQRLLNELRGIQAVPWEEKIKASKNIMTSRSFGQATQAKDFIAEALSNHAAACAQKLREQKTCAGSVHVFVNTNPFRAQDKQYYRSIDLKFPVATNFTNDIIKQALRGLDIIFKEGLNYHKTGVMMQDIVPESVVQSSLFDHSDREGMKDVMKAMDGINAALGKETVRFAVQGFDKRYRLRAEYISQHFTTDINQIQIITT